MPYNYNGAGAFAPSGVTYKLAYVGDSTDTSYEINAAGAVQVLAEQNIAIAFGTTDGDTQAIYPTTDGEQGEGCIVQKEWQTVLAIPQVAGYNTTGKMFVSVAGEVAGNVFISLGDLV